MQTCHMLKSRDVRPPGGWKLHQAETSWDLKPGYCFNDAVSAIIKHRNDNPRFNLSTDREVVAVELDNYTCALLKNNSQWCVAGSALSFPKPLPSKQRAGEGKGAVAGGSSFLKNASVGIKVWIDFFGDGKPVEKAIAEKRAATCLAGDDGKMCPYHEEGSLMQRLTAAAGKELLAIKNALNDLDMHSSRDRELKNCTKCDCPLVAKIWVPMPIIKKHMSPETVESLPSFCWIREI